MEKRLDQQVSRFDQQVSRLNELFSISLVSLQMQAQKVRFNLLQSLKSSLSVDRSGAPSTAKTEILIFQLKI